MSAVPATTIEAATRDILLGRSPVLIQIAGNMITGDIALSMATIPNGARFTAHNNKLMPTAIPNVPLAVIFRIIFLLSKR